MNEAVYGLKDVSGDTTFRYSNMSTYITQPVYVRVTTKSTYATIRYTKSYLESAPSTAMTAITLNTKYELNIMNPYMTIMVQSY